MRNQRLLEQPSSKFGMFDAASEHSFGQLKTLIDQERNELSQKTVESVISFAILNDNYNESQLLSTSHQQPQEEQKEEEEVEQEILAENLA